MFRGLKGGVTNGLEGIMRIIQALWFSIVERTLILFSFLNSLTRPRQEILFIISCVGACMCVFFYSLPFQRDDSFSVLAS